MFEEKCFSLNLAFGQSTKSFFPRLLSETGNTVNIIAASKLAAKIYYREILSLVPGEPDKRLVLGNSMIWVEQCPSKDYLEDFLAEGIELPDEDAFIAMVTAGYADRSKANSDQPIRRRR